MASVSKQLVFSVIDGLAITTDSLPVAIVGVEYNVQCIANGGFVPYVWSASGLPEGVTISPEGVISGTPTSTFTGDVTITVTDAESVA